MPTGKFEVQIVRIERSNSIDDRLCFKVMRNVGNDVWPGCEHGRRANELRPIRERKEADYRKEKGKQLSVIV